jgi:hypothetical protein
MVKRPNLEDDKLIAKFMGLEIITDSISWFDTSYKPLAKYSESWNHLMPVITKIGEMDLDFEPLANVSLYTPIGEIHKEVVEFLKSYNP